MADLLDNCRFLAGSTGTADFADGISDLTFRNLEDAGAEDGKTYPYKAQNATGTEWEIGRGMALNTSGGWILERTSIQDSSNGGSLVNFGTAPKVIITAGREEFGAETIAGITRAQAITRNIPSVAASIQTNGYAAAGDGGAALYKRVLTEPTHAGKFQSNDGAWWELRESEVTPEMFDDISNVDNTSAVRWAFNYAVATGAKIVGSSRTYFLTDQIEVHAPGQRIAFDFSRSVFDATGVPANEIGFSVGQIFIFSGELGTPIALTENVVAHGSLTDADDYGRISLTSTAGLSVGQIGLLESDGAIFSGSPVKRGELLHIMSIDGDDIIVSDHIVINYATSDNAKFTPMDPITVTGDMGLIIGGGVGSGHGAVEIVYGYDCDLSGRSDWCENHGLKLDYIYNARGHWHARYCTSPQHLGEGNTGYGVLVAAGRYVDYTVEAVRCRHAVAGGGLHPAMFVKIRGHETGSGIGTQAWDAHEACLFWEFDVSSNGAGGGVIFRGIGVTIRYHGVNTAFGVRVRTFTGGTRTQSRISIPYLYSENCGGSALILGDAAEARIEDVTLGTIIIRKARQDAIVATNIGELTFDAIECRGYIQLSGDTVGTGFNHLRLTDVQRTVGQKLVSRGALRRGIYAVSDCGIIDIDSVSISGAGMRPADFPGVNRLIIGGGRIESATVEAPIFANGCASMTIKADLIGDTGQSTQDGIRAVSCTDITLTGSRVVAGRHAIYASDSSNYITAVGNNFRQVVSSTKVNAPGGADVVDTANLV